MENLEISNDMLDDLKIYQGKKVLVTGHTGFKGSWLSLWLNSLGAELIGISLPPRGESDNFVMTRLSAEMKDYRADIRNLEQILQICEQEQPEILFHLAAQPIVLESYDEPVATFQTNIQGTVHLLEAIRKTKSLHTGIFITSDKCYHNKEWVWGYRESDRLGGHDPYSCSKGAAELVIDSYRKSFFTGNEKNIASARAGNVIGGGDWTPFRIVPDCIRAFEQHLPLEMRSPNAIRPWQHVLDPIGGYLLLGARMLMQRNSFDQAWNFGPEQSGMKTVEELVQKLIAEFGHGSYVAPQQERLQHEATFLALDISKAKYLLNWKPVFSFDEAVRLTAEWYRTYKTDDMKTLCLEQIKLYCEKWNS